MHFVFPDIVTILLRKPDIPFISDYNQGFLAQTTSRHRLYRIWVVNTRPSIWRRWSDEPWRCQIIQMALWLYYGFINIPKGAFIAAGIGYKWKDDRNWYQMDFFSNRYIWNQSNSEFYSTLIAFIGLKWYLNMCFCMAHWHYNQTPYNMSHITNPISIPN